MLSTLCLVHVPLIASANSHACSSNDSPVRGAAIIFESKGQINLHLVVGTRYYAINRYAKQRPRESSVSI